MAVTRKRSQKRVVSRSKYSEKDIMLQFLEMLNIIKVYHWKTLSYSTHKATDELYSDLSSRTDEFIETMLGKSGSRVNLMSTKYISFHDYDNVDDFKACIEKFKQYLINMNSSKTLNLKSNSDLLNIRDEILGDLNKFTYLLTLK